MFSGNFVLMVLVIGVLIGLLLKQIIVGFAYGITCLLCGFPTKRALDATPAGVADVNNQSGFASLTQTVRLLRGNSKGFIKLAHCKP